MESPGAEALAEYFERVDSIEEIDLSRNQIIDDGIIAVTNGLIKSAQRGTLRSLNISYNFVNNSEAVTGLVTLITLAKELRVVDLSVMYIDNPRFQERMIEALTHLTQLNAISWNQDIGVDKVGENVISRFIESLPELKHLELQGSIHSKTRRDELRAMAEQRGIKLVLTLPDD